MSDETDTRFSDLRLDTGPRLHVTERGDPSGRAVLFLHGWPDSGFSFSRVLSHLPPELRAIAVDQRGFGDSDRPEAGYAIRDLAADAIACLDALGIERATLVGHSFGTFVARQAAIARPQRIEALALIGTGYSPVNSVTREVQRALTDLPDPVPLDFVREFQAGTIHHPVPPDFFGDIVAESHKLPSRLWRLTFDSLLEYDDAPDLSTIAAPTLLLWGDHDALFTRDDQDRLLEVLPSARLTVYEDTGHCPNWERPERVAADVAKLVLGG
jgi:pimeloyl-ACP methyl ester carboxylesterase